MNEKHSLHTQAQTSCCMSFMSIAECNRFLFHIIILVGRPEFLKPLHSFHSIQTRRRNGGEEEVKRKKKFVVMRNSKTSNNNGTSANLVGIIHSSTVFFISLLFRFDSIRFSAPDRFGNGVNHHHTQERKKKLYTILRIRSNLFRSVRCWTKRM